jgi:acetylornithine aminotransferase
MRHGLIMAGSVPPVPVSPLLRRQTVYPFVRLEEAKRRVAAQGVRILDFGVGDPRGKPEPFIRDALVAALDETSGYPLAQGLPELRGAVADWCRRRFGVALDPHTQVIPTLGSKEAIFTFAQAIVDPASERDTVIVTEPGYPVPERGALFAHARVERLPLRGPAFVPDLDSIEDETWRRLALFWLNYPNNPTGATAPLELYEHLVELAHEHGFVLASDEAYSELWFDEPPASALQVGDLTNVAVFNSLSKRSSMTGYRSGFVAGDPSLIAALRTFRPTVGTAPQEFVQRAAIVAWGDEAHVERNRAGYKAKRDLFLDLFARKDLAVAGSRATMYLWIHVPDGETSESFAERLLQRGVVVAPGSYLGESGEGYVRLALVPSEEDCRQAVAILEELL